MTYPDPISKEIRDYANTNPRFRDSLKMLNDDEFIALNTIILTYPDTLPVGYEVIGVFHGCKSKLRTSKGILFKQDYIVKDTEGNFTLYTWTPEPNHHVRPIKEFKEKIGAGKHYGSDKPGGFDHWYMAVNELPIELQKEAQEILNKYHISL